ncbi:HD domain-containing protein [Konateibacter massiliensis]|uniref:HD domain-containing protein n=1 Tax=Konateibacter massiliensis TaxID=2002841 RepID=UPI000C14A505|nr:HD domain-containing protein [Konateibacter massiliensis]
MLKEKFQEIESYMCECMNDSAHDREHVYRVLYTALDIAKYEENINYDILITACLLHDIGREEQFQNPNLCHAIVGGDKANQYLLECGWEPSDAQAVKECIISHRYRTHHLPQIMEAKILFDADKLDVTGTLGIARTLFYKGYVSEPLYSTNVEGEILDGSKDNAPSFFQEYKFKLERLYDKFYTKRGQALAMERQKAAVDFYNNMLREVQSAYSLGKGQLDKVLDF